LGAGLRAIKPLRSFKIKVWPYKLQGLGITRDKSLRDLIAGLRAINPFGSK